MQLRCPLGKYSCMVPTLFTKDNMYVIFKNCMLIKISEIESRFNVNCHSRADNIYLIFKN